VEVEVAPHQAAAPAVTPGPAETFPEAPQAVEGQAASSLVAPAGSALRRELRAHLASAEWAPPAPSASLVVVGVVVGITAVAAAAAAANFSPRVVLAVAVGRAS
jgi:hypothetical protein